MAEISQQQIVDNTKVLGVNKTYDIGALLIEDS